MMTRTDLLSRNAQNRVKMGRNPQHLARRYIHHSECRILPAHSRLGIQGSLHKAGCGPLVPVIDMLYIAIQAFCLILSGARSNEFGFTDIAVSWASSVIMGFGVFGSLLSTVAFRH